MITASRGFGLICIANPFCRPGRPPRYNAGMTEAGFHPPTAEQVAEHLETHHARLPSPWIAGAPLAALLGMLFLSLIIPGAAVMCLTWVVFLGVIAYMQIRAYRQRELDKQTRVAQELAMLKRYPESLRMCWQSLPSVAAIPPLRQRTVACVAHCLDQLNQHEAAIVAYDDLLRVSPPNSPMAAAFEIQRAIAQLAVHRLADADDALRRARKMVDRMKQSTVAAGYRLALIVQQFRTHHHKDIVAESSDAVDTLRPLGVDAGYGHALIAMAHHLVGTRNDSMTAAQHESVDDASQQWWSRATLLLPEDVLIGRFPELKELPAVDHAAPAIPPRSNAENQPPSANDNLIEPTAPPSPPQQDQV